MPAHAEDIRNFLLDQKIRNIRGALRPGRRVDLSRLNFAIWHIDTSSSTKLFRDTETAIEGVRHTPEHRLYLLIGSDSLQAFFAAQPTVFESAKRRCSGELLVRIDPDHSRVQGPRYSPSPFVIGSPDPRSQSVADVVRLLHEIVFIIEWHGAQHRPKNFLLCNV